VILLVLGSITITTGQFDVRQSGPGQRGIVTEEQGATTIKTAAVGRDTNPTIPDSELSQIVAGNNAFAVDLYKKLAEGNENTFFSPYSITVAFGMAFGGARGQTEKEIARTLHFPFSRKKLHNGINALDLALKASAKNNGFELNSVNQLWGENSYSFLPEYLNLISEKYGASLRLLDFKNHPDPSRTVINEWVSDRTNGRIKNLIPAGGISDSTKLVLTNAIYFKAKWEKPFKVEATKDGQFNCATGDFVTTKFMSQTSEFFAVNANEYQAVSMPYKGMETSMLVIMPEPGKMKSVEAALSPEFLKSVTNSLEESKIKLRLPKFKFTTGSLELTKILQSLGMRSSFTGAADFSGIDGTKSLFIEGVYHKAFVSVDEKETEAAAATSIALMLGGVGTYPIPEYNFDRPFIFLIRDNKTGTVLFLGKINDPTKK
jgi:serpin B